MKYVLICLMFANLSAGFSNTENDYIGWNEKSFQFIRCEKTYDKSNNVLAKDVKYYNFIFNPKTKYYDNFKILLCLDDSFGGGCKNGSSSSSSQEINCVNQKNNQIVCPLIKGLVNYPLKQKGVLNITLNFYGINKTGTYSLLEKYFELHHCFLRGCINFAPAVTIRKYNYLFGMNQLEYQLNYLPVKTKNLFNHFFVSITMFNSFNNQSMHQKNQFWNMSNIPLINQDEKFNFVSENSTCLSNYNKICVKTEWDFCLKNSVNKWQAIHHCTDFSYTRQLPKFFLSCHPNITNQISISQNSNVKSIDPRIFYFAVNIYDKFGRKVELINTTNMTISSGYAASSYYEVSLCDRCQCGEKIDINCQIKGPPPVKTSVQTPITIIVAVISSVILIICLGLLFYYLKNKRQSKDNDEQINPGNDYAYTDHVKYAIHPYYDPSTQKENNVKVAIL